MGNKFCIELFTTFVTTQFDSMNKKINWWIPIIIFAIIGLYYVYSNTIKAPSEPLSINADSVVFTRGCATPEASCFRVSFVFPSIVSDVPNRLTRNMLSDYLQMVEDSSSVSTMNDFKNKLVENSLRFDSAFVDYTGAFPDAAYIDWYLKINYEVLRNDSKVLTIRYLYSDYMGGAHGIQNYHYQNYDVRKSKRIELTDVFENVKDFYAVAESAFNAKYLDGKEKSSVNFGFPNDKFILPREFGFGDKGLLLHYNVYEIASYVQGDILLEIPYSSVKETLKPKWKYLVE